MKFYDLEWLAEKCGTDNKYEITTKVSAEARRESEEFTFDKNNPDSNERFISNVLSEIENDTSPISVNYAPAKVKITVSAAPEQEKIITPEPKILPEMEPEEEADEKEDEEENTDIEETQDEETTEKKPERKREKKENTERTKTKTKKVSEKKSKPAARTKRTTNEEKEEAKDDTKTESEPAEAEAVEVVEAETAETNSDE